MTVKKHKTLTVVASMAVAAFALSSCGSGGSQQEEVSAPMATTTVTATVAVTVTPSDTSPEPTTAPPTRQESQTARPEPTQPEEPEPETFRMPRLVGKNLQDAQDELQSLGSFFVDQQDASGLGRLQLVDSNWKVCRQKPAAGKAVPLSAIVVLASVKLNERCP